ncbi:MAG: S4 domain-containing protein, partial [Bacillota bacterium]|nr:S4 domain-containing protein [Bacillota bacterium]
MRLDKFLKVSRLIKRRTLAKDVSDQGRIEVNGRVAKPSNELKLGDIITLN